jgi:DNA primase
VAKIPEEILQKFKDELRNRVSILDVVGEHVVLRKQGSNYSGLCPFHSERSPSFTVNDSKQMFHCFGCKAGGDLIKFVMEIHGLGFMEALEELAERARIRLPSAISDASERENPELAKKRQAEREKLQLAHKLNRFVAGFYRDSLPRSTPALKYLKKRGLDPSADSVIARNFYLGASPSGWDPLAQFLGGKKAPMELAVELGLIRPSQRGAGYFDLFRERVIFPILDLRGKVVGFGGRTIPGLAVPEASKEAEKEAGPKYLNSSESFVFKKGKVAYGLYQAQKHIRETDEIILVEGYFDVLGLHAGGFENAVATCGTALTLDHIHAFRRIGKKLILLFDSDRAGEEATERAMELGLEQGWVFYGATLPPGTDPDEVIFDRETGEPIPGGREKMRAILDSARPVLDVRIEQAIAASKAGSEALSIAIKQIAGWLGRFNDPVGREVRLQAAARQLGVDPALIFRAGGARSTPVATKPPQSVPRPVPAARPLAKVPDLSRSEKVVLRGLVWGRQFSEVLAKVRAQMPPGQGLWELFDHPASRDWVKGVVSDPSQLSRLRSAPDTLVGRVESPQVLSTITEALLAQDPPHTLEEFQGALNRRTHRCWVRFSHHVKKSLGSAEASGDAELHAKLMQEYVDLQRKIKEFANFYDDAE